MFQRTHRTRQNLVLLRKLIIGGVILYSLSFGWKLFLHSLPIGTEYMHNPQDQLRLRFQRDMREGWRRSAWQALSPEAQAKISSRQLAATEADPFRIAKLFQDAQIAPPSSGKLTVFHDRWGPARVLYSVTEDVKIQNFTIIPPSEFTSGPPPNPRPSLPPMPTPVVSPPPRECAAFEGLTAQDCAAFGTLVPEALSQQAYLKASDTRAGEMLGSSVAMWGDTVLVGAMGRGSPSRKPGAAYIFTRNGSTWTQQAILHASNASGGDRFGVSVAIWGDTAVVGALNAANGSGAAYVFRRTGTTWSEQAVLQASHTEAEDSFGSSVAIWNDTVVVGARYEASAALGVNGDGSDNTAFYAGAAYVFARTGTRWTEQAYLKASNTYARDQFGSSVAICGDSIVVGAPGEGSMAVGVDGDGSSNTYSASGAAYVFRRTGTTWRNQAYLKASNTMPSAQFGSSVAIWGDTIVVGAKGEANGTAHLTSEQGDTSALEAGAAYIFAWSDTTWKQQAYLKASFIGADDRFGSSVAIWDATVVVGALNSPYGAGAIYVFGRDGATWNGQAVLNDPTMEGNDIFGQDVALSGNTIINGASLEDSAAVGVNGDRHDNSATDAGATYIFVGSAPTASP